MALESGHIHHLDGWCQIKIARECGLLPRLVGRDQILMAEESGYIFHLAGWDQITIAYGHGLLLYLTG